MGNYDRGRVMRLGMSRPICIHGRLPESSSMIKSSKSFRVLPFSKKATSSEAFWKQLHQTLSYDDRVFSGRLLKQPLAGKEQVR